MPAIPIAEGDVLEIDAALGPEQRGRRPVLVVSVDSLHAELGLAMVCAIAIRSARSTGARSDLEVAIPAGLPLTGAILPLQLRTIDSKARNATKLCTMPRSVLQSVRSRLKALLGLGK
jgi:mRNA interferase MazF